jgi:hypothetical protein
MDTRNTKRKVPNRKRLTRDNAQLRREILELRAELSIVKRIAAFAIRGQQTDRKDGNNPNRNECRR